MRIPKVKPRRYYDIATFGKTYKESDRDFAQNNLAACIWFLEHRDDIHRMLKSKAPTFTHRTVQHVAEKKSRLEDNA